jgi:phage shock protein PspC (stress-responsive transcriptional regulator)
MEENTTTETPEAPAASDELVRPLEGRIVAGVAQGLARRMRIEPWLVRAAFIILAFAGGAGVALYGAAWFLIRAEDQPESAAQRVFGNASGTRAWVGIGLVFIAALILLENFTFLDGGVVWAIGLLVVGLLLYTGDLPRLFNREGSEDTDDKEGVQQMTTDTQVTTTTDLVTEPETPSGGEIGGGAPPTPTPTPPILPPSAPREPVEHSILGRLTIGFILLGLGVLAVLDNIPWGTVEPEPRHYLALAITILGIGLLVGAFVGRARWLILVGVIMIPLTLTSQAFELDWNSDEFEATESPATFEELDDEYQLDIGNLQLDLTRLPWDGREVPLDVSVDAGNVEIILPPGVGVTGSAEVSVGRVSAFGREVSGLGDPSLEFNNPGARGTVDLEANVDIGNIEIQYGITRG